MSQTTPNIADSVIWLRLSEAVAVYEFGLTAARPYERLTGSWLHRTPVLWWC